MTEKRVNTDRSALRLVNKFWKTEQPRGIFDVVDALIDSINSAA
ncbi:MAG: hypothetical protein AAF152_08440 [Cyanobacteria bacterium P01_A01_bin.114]